MRILAGTGEGPSPASSSQKPAASTPALWPSLPCVYPPPSLQPSSARENVWGAPGLLAASQGKNQRFPPDTPLTAHFDSEFHLSTVTPSEKLLNRHGLQCQPSARGQVILGPGHPQGFALTLLSALRTWGCGRGENRMHLRLQRGHGTQLRTQG